MIPFQADFLKNSKFRSSMKLEKQNCMWNENQPVIVEMSFNIANSLHKNIVKNDELRLFDVHQWCKNTKDEVLRHKDT